MYVPVKVKFISACLIASFWFIFCAYFSIPWIQDLAHYVGLFFSIFFISFIALIPGFMYMFLTVSYMFDNRTSAKELSYYPPVSILIAAYNEEENIKQTIDSVLAQDYKGKLQIIVVDDGSTDNTVKILQDFNINNLLIIQNGHGGKANCLNTAVKNTEHEYLLCLDADTLLWHDAVKNIIERLLSDPENTAAIAGTLYVRNSRQNLLTRMEEWDFFLAITAIKRMQSLFQGTLVAQGAFSLYLKKYVIEVGGWQTVVGEDIVISWALLAKGYRLGFADQAIAFTSVPETYKAFFSQRKRWARGLIEAFRSHPEILVVKRYILLLAYWNLMFPIMDFVYLIIFIPGLILAFFGYYIIAGPMTLALLPLALTYNLIYYITQRNVFERAHLTIRDNKSGFILYVLFYQLVMVPACVAGYISEILSLRKKWGTK